MPNFCRHTLDPLHALELVGGVRSCTGSIDVDLFTRGCETKDQFLRVLGLFALAQLGTGTNI